MSEAARSLARPRAAVDLASLVLDLAGGTDARGGKRPGIVAIDTRPEQMDEALINQYLAAKFRNRL